MGSLRTETSNVLLFDPDKHRSTVHVFTADPSPLEERSLGRLFLLVEIDDNSEEGLTVIQALQEAVLNAYYRGENLSVEAAFEQALQEANRELQQLLGERIESWLPHFHCIIGVIKNEALHFTIIGRMHGFLVHRQRILDILDSSGGGPAEEPSALKIFTNIVSGQLQADDSLLFCTTSLLDHLSQEKIKRILLDGSVEDAAGALESLLATAEGPSPFGVLILRTLPALTSVAAPALRTQRPAIKRPQDSMSALIEKERATSSLLNHSLWPTLGRMVKGRNEQKDRPDAPVEPEAPATPPRPLPSRQLTPRSTGKDFLSTIGTALWTVIKAVVLGLIAFVRWAIAFTKKNLANRRPKDLPTAANRSLARGASRLASLSPQRRRLLLLAVIVLLLFSQSIVTMGHQRDQRKTEDQYQTAITEAREKVDAADAALLINNESGARSLLSEARDRLATVPSNKKNLQDDVSEVAGLIDQRLATLRHAVTVSPELVYDLGTLAVNFSSHTIGSLGTSIFTVDEHDDSVFGISSEKKSDVIISAPSLEDRLTTILPGASGSLQILQANGGVQQVDVSRKTISTLPVEYANVDRTVVAGLLFNNRLYTLDTTNNTIVRHERSGAGYSAGTNWLGSGHPDLTDAVSMAIDGAIYVLHGNGVIDEFTAGTKTDVSFDAPDPAFTSPVKLWTDAATETLFVLDPSASRVVEYTKDGSYLRQYVADSFADGRDLLVKDGTVYVLAGTKLVSFAIVE